MTGDGTVRVVIIDHYDSYTNNILQLLQGIRTHGGGKKYQEWDPVIIRTLHAPSDRATLGAMTSKPVTGTYEHDFQVHILPHVDAVILSPGPGRPDRTRDFGFNEELLRTANIPILGICLGHQGMSTAFGGGIVEAKNVRHGLVSSVTHNQQGIMKSVPQGVEVVRYNSLLVDERLIPPDLELTAWTFDDEDPSVKVVMGLQHRTRPMFGTQWHPESICSAYGRKILSNFRDIVHYYWTGSSPYQTQKSRAITKGAKIPEHIVRQGAVMPQVRSSLPSITASPSELHVQNSPYFVKAIPLGNLSAANNIYERFILGKSADGEVWLDSAKVCDSHSRNSYMASASAGLTYDANLRELKFTQDGTVMGTLRLRASFWHWLNYFQSSVVQASTTALCEDSLGQKADIGQPLLQVGLIGYLGYELGHESLPGYRSQPSKGGRKSLRNTDSHLLFADRILWLDNYTGQWKAIGLIRRGHADPIGKYIKAGRPLGRKEADFDAWAATLREDRSPTLPPIRPLVPLPTFTSKDDESSYCNGIAAAKEAIRQGEAYELTLTTEFNAQSSEDPYGMYLSLRINNAAPYSAYLNIPHLDISVLSSSPERFLSIDRNSVTEMKPIKGTVAVSANEEENERRKVRLATNKKELAENLMIVDLIRSDLHNICSSKSIRVEGLMQVESYETVHQLVTTIQGHISPDIGSVKAVECCFPPGSMTGAPKLRSVQMLEDLEQQRRGIYSGSLGYFCVSGTVDQSVVIRTIVRHGDNLSLGAGGAITWLSEPDAEWEEVMIKANAVTNALPAKEAVFAKELDDSALG
ncbi:MAG: Protein phosphatase PP2A regulatory subunit B [Piccolia ochrophora]|nr:MAG: Protein phosphatase PP2A regulatory subunit B [Piccolia ochrophora]